jgi:replication factor C subunit 3/5
MASRLWIDKYRPQSLGELDYHEELNNLLRNLATSSEIPHLLFYGPPGAGKKTRVLALLEEIFGSGVHRIKHEVRTFKQNSTSFEVNIQQSNFHIDLTPSDVAQKDKVVVQQVIKEIGSSRAPDSRVAFKAVILNQADYLTHEAQAALRRTLEKYTSTTRLILICNSLCRVIAPLRSRCLNIRVPAPSCDQIASILTKISEGEGIQVAPEFIDKLVGQSDRNLRKAIMSLQTASLKHGRLTPGTPVSVPEWEKQIREVAMNAIDEQTPRRLKLIRTKLYEILSCCIPPNTIFGFLSNVLVNSCSDGSIKYSIIDHAAKYQKQMQQGSKPIVHLEAFLARFMTIYRQHLTRSAFS